MACNASNLLHNFFNSDGITSGICRERNLMLSEGHRVVFLNYNYNTTNGKLKYAASIFRRDVVPDWSNWDSTHQDLSVNHNSVVFFDTSKDATPYFQIT